VRAILSFLGLTFLLASAGAAQQA
ncbi:uncharacterized protein METZ01_LOCUS181763, partial [marine metagenome]